MKHTREHFRKITTTVASSRIQLMEFTLIELLVVVAIIAILAALLFPALKGVKTKTQSIVCCNNQKQIGVGFMNYAQDNSEFYPWAWYDGGDDNTQWYRWTSLLVKDYDISGESFICPSKPDHAIGGAPSNRALWLKAKKYAHADNNYFWGAPAYGYNYFFIGFDWLATPKGPPAKISQIERPSEKILIAESADYNDRNRGYYTVAAYHSSANPVLWPNHDNVCVVLWVDCHATGETASARGEPGSKSLYQADRLGNYNLSTNHWDRK